MVARLATVFAKDESTVFALTGYAALCSAKPICVMLRVFLSGNNFSLLVSGRGVFRNLKLRQYKCLVYKA